MHMQTGLDTLLQDPQRLRRLATRRVASSAPASEVDAGTASRKARRGHYVGDERKRRSAWMRRC